MSVDKLVDSTQLDSDLTSVANAIRTKGGTSAQLAFPSGFVSAINAIPTGGGGYTADDWLSVSKPTGTVSTTVAGSFGASRIYGRTGITGLSMPNATSIGDSFARGCSNLESVYLPKLTTINGSSLRGCKFSTLVLPSLTKIGGQYPFHDNAYLTAVDFGGVAAAQLKQYYMSNNSTLWTVLVLRSTTMWSLSGTNVFQYSRFYKTTSGASATGKGGTIYVPSSLLSTYQADTKWAALLSENTNNQMKTIESTHTDPNAPIDLTLYYADGTLIPTT